MERTSRISKPNSRHLNFVPSNILVSRRTVLSNSCRDVVVILDDFKTRLPLTSEIGTSPDSFTDASRSDFVCPKRRRVVTTKISLPTSTFTSIDNPSPCNVISVIPPLILTTQNPISVSVSSDTLIDYTPTVITPTITAAISDSVPSRPSRLRGVHQLSQKYRNFVPSSAAFHFRKLSTSTEHNSVTATHHKLSDHHLIIECQNNHIDSICPTNQQSTSAAAVIVHSPTVPGAFCSLNSNVEQNTYTPAPNLSLDSHRPGLTSPHIKIDENTIVCTQLNEPTSTVARVSDNFYQTAGLCQMGFSESSVPIISYEDDTSVSTAVTTSLRRQQERDALIERQRLLCAMIAERFFGPRSNVSSAICENSINISQSILLLDDNPARPVFRCIDESALRIHIGLPTAILHTLKVSSNLRPGFSKGNTAFDDSNIYSADVSISMSSKGDVGFKDSISTAYISNRTVDEFSPSSTRFKVPSCFTVASTPAVVLVPRIRVLHTTLRSEGREECYHDFVADFDWHRGTGADGKKQIGIRSEYRLRCNAFAALRLPVAITPPSIEQGLSVAEKRMQRYALASARSRKTQHHNAVIGGFGSIDCGSRRCRSLYIQRAPVVRSITLSRSSPLQQKLQKLSSVTDLPLESIPTIRVPDILSSNVTTNVDSFSPMSQPLFSERRQIRPSQRAQSISADVWLSRYKRKSATKIEPSCASSIAVDPLVPNSNSTSTVLTTPSYHHIQFHSSGMNKRTCVNRVLSRTQTHEVHSTHGNQKDVAISRLAPASSLQKKMHSKQFASHTQHESVASPIIPLYHQWSAISKFDMAVIQRSIRQRVVRPAPVRTVRAKIITPNSDSHEIKTTSAAAIIIRLRVIDREAFRVTPCPQTFVDPYFASQSMLSTLTSDNSNPADRKIVDDCPVLLPRLPFHAPYTSHSVSLVDSKFGGCLRTPLNILRNLACCAKIQAIDRDPMFSSEITAVPSEVDPFWMRRRLRCDERNHDHTDLKKATGDWFQPSYSTAALFAFTDEPLVLPRREVQLSSHLLQSFTSHQEQFVNHIDIDTSRVMMEPPRPPLARSRALRPVMVECTPASTANNTISDLSHDKNEQRNDMADLTAGKELDIDYSHKTGELALLDKLNDQELYVAALQMFGIEEPNINVADSSVIPDVEFCRPNILIVNERFTFSCPALQSVPWLKNELSPEAVISADNCHCLHHTEVSTNVMSIIEDSELPSQDVLPSVMDVMPESVSMINLSSVVLPNTVVLLDSAIATSDAMMLDDVSSQTFITDGVMSDSGNQPDATVTCAVVPSVRRGRPRNVMKFAGGQPISTLPALATSPRNPYIVVTPVVNIDSVMLEAGYHGSTLQKKSDLNLATGHAINNNTTNDIVRLWNESVPSIVNNSQSFRGQSSIRFLADRCPANEDEYMMRLAKVYFPLAENPSGCARAEVWSRVRTVIPEKAQKRRRTAVSSSSLDDDFDTNHNQMQQLTAKYIAATRARLQQPVDLNGFFVSKLRVGASVVQGIGLFAECSYHSDDFVVEYVGEIIRNPIADVRERQRAIQQIFTDYMFRLDEEYIIDATHKASNARFINHSCSPNCYAVIVSVTGVDLGISNSVEPMKRVAIFAKRHIHFGEELSYDYKFEMEDESKKITCLCGALNCRGSVN